MVRNRSVLLKSLVLSIGVDRYTVRSRCYCARLFAARDLARYYHCRFYCKFFQIDSADLTDFQRLKCCWRSRSEINCVLVTLWLKSFSQGSNSYILIAALPFWWCNAKQLFSVCRSWCYDHATFALYNLCGITFNTRDRRETSYVGWSELTFHETLVFPFP